MLEHVLVQVSALGWALGWDQRLVWLQVLASLRKRVWTQTQTQVSVWDWDLEPKQD